MNYILRKKNDGVIVTCDSCESAVPTKDFPWPPPYTLVHDLPFRPLCEYCANTYTANYAWHARIHNLNVDLQAEIWKATAAAVNFLLHHRRSSQQAELC